jgi:hypothetical protein
VVRVGTSKGSTISLWLQYIRGISYRGPTERKKKEKKTTTRIGDSKSKVAPVRTMKAYWGSRGTAPLNPNIDTRCRLLASFMPQALVLRANLNVLALSAANSSTVHPHSIAYVGVHKK